MSALRLVLAAAAVTAALAACPNQCSGHGECHKNDLCTCYQNWQGPDCSLRTCAFGNSWALDAANPHSYEECSGAGLCERSSGECRCFAGFDGYACQRRTCPNGCSGHGMCRLLVELKTIVPYSADNWDSEKIQACVCDAGYFGTDCSQRRCATGDDPLTLCDNKNQGMVQEIRVTLGSALSYDPTTATGAAITASNTLEGMDLFGTSGSKNFNVLQEEEGSAQLHIGAVDTSGQVYYAPTAAKAVFAKDRATRLANTLTIRADPGEDSIETALENIPSFKVRNVKVTGRFTKPNAGNAANGNGIDKILEKRYLVTFVPDTVHSANFGLQNNLVCDSGYGCGNAGCSPTVKMPFLYRYAATRAEQSTIDSYPVLPAASFDFFTGAANRDADFALNRFVRLADSSMPRLPPGVSVDTGVTSSNLDRYDIRVVVAVQDPADQNSGDSPTDVYWTKVVYTNTNITTDVTEYWESDGTSPQSAGVFSDSKKSGFVGTLSGFVARGFIPPEKKASIPDAPGVILEFPDVDMIHDDQHYKFFEILIKLPSCKVSPVLAPGFVDVDGLPIEPVDSQVENIECSNRGQCNRETGLCDCFTGYYGLSCHRQTVLV